MLSLYSIQSIICLSLYSILILAFFAGWMRTKRYIPEKIPPAIRVTILIPFRNESENIPELVSALLHQQYPEHLLQVIWIDDHSTDGSDGILKNLIRDLSNWELIRLTGPGSGKKAALKAGMEMAAGELILLTDADSLPGTHWVYSMAEFFEFTGSDLILGPVMLDPAPGWFDQVQKLDYLSLAAASAGSTGIGHPMMAQGPNIGIRAANYKIIVNDLDNRFASGDDVFLMQAMKRIPGKKIGYLMNPDAIVRSKPTRSMAAFIRQRSRWASKAKGYTDPFMILTTLLVFAANIEILAALILGLSGLVPFYLFLILSGIKILADLPVLMTAMRFFRSNRLLWWMIPVQVIYPAYITATGIISQTMRVKWKNPV